MEDKKREKGSITLEMSIILPIFMFMFFSIYGLFSIVNAHNQISHALIQSSKSLSLDSYLLENIESAGESATKFWGGLSDMALDFYRLNNNQYYTSRTDWHASDAGNPEVAKNRFVGYFAGGDENKANEALEDLGVVDGLDGIEFSTKVEDEDFYVTIKYEIQSWFDFMDMGKIPMKQTIKARLWK